MSTIIMWVLIGFYAVIGVCAACERNWWRALYFVGAIIITLAVIGMTGRPRIRGPPWARHG